MSLSSNAPTGDAVDQRVNLGAGPPDGSNDQLATQLARLVRLTARARSRVFRAGPDGLETAAYAILLRLIAHGPQRASRLAELLHSDISTISRQSSALVEHGLVERQADPEDGRAALLAATAEGLRVFEENRRDRNELVGRVLSDWSDDDRLALNTLLARLLDCIERSELLSDRPPAEASAPCGSGTGSDGPDE